jgi:hypothetical protein
MSFGMSLPYQPGMSLPHQPGMSLPYQPSMSLQYPGMSFPSSIPATTRTTVSSSPSAMKSAPPVALPSRSPGTPSRSPSDSYTDAPSLDISPFPYMIIYETTNCVPRDWTVHIDIDLKLDVDSLSNDSSQIYAMAREFVSWEDFRFSLCPKVGQRMLTEQNIDIRAESEVTGMEAHVTIVDNDKGVFTKSS